MLDLHECGVASVRKMFASLRAEIGPSEDHDFEFLRGKETGQIPRFPVPFEVLQILVAALMRKSCCLLTSNSFRAQIVTLHCTWLLPAFHDSKVRWIRSKLMNLGCSMPPVSHALLRSVSLCLCVSVRLCVCVCVCDSVRACRRNAHRKWSNLPTCP